MRAAAWGCTWKFGVLQHAGESDDAPQLRLTPLPLHRRSAEGAGQFRGFTTEVILAFQQPAHLLGRSW